MKAIRMLALATVLAASIPLKAQTTSSPQGPARESEPDPAALRAMKSRIFIIQHKDPFQLQLSLEALCSGTKGARMNWAKQDDGLNTITVRDFPENLVAIEEAIKRLDVPAAPRKSSDVELNVHVLFASKGSVPDGALPSDLQDVVKQLKNTLAYRGYTLAASFVQRVQVLDNGRSETSGLGYVLPGILGTAEGKDTARMKVEWRAQGLKVNAPAEGPSVLSVGTFRMDLEEETGTRSGTLAKFNTPLSLKEGERVVVGTSVVKDHGVVVVLMVKRMK